MNITKEQADKVIAALETTYFREIDIPAREQALSIMRGLEDAEPEHSSQNIAIKLLRDRVELARKFPTNTCPASRHLHLIAEHLASGKPYPMLQEEPEHCAETMLSVLESLWNARNKLAATSSQAAQTAVKSESSAQAAQALARPPSEGKTIEALAPIQAAQTEAQNGCLSNCRNCQHFRRDTGGHCYMFKEEPQGVCAQFKASWAFW